MKYIRKRERATAWQLANKRLIEIDAERNNNGDKFDVSERFAICMLMHRTWFPGVDKY